MDKDIQREIRKIISEIEEKSTDGNYIYRGEPETHEGHPYYGKVSSSLWREYDLEGGNFDIEVIQKEILNGAKKHIGDLPQDFRIDLAASLNLTQEESDRAIDFELLTEIQHYGGRTNLIDFTTHYFIALFFACDGHHDKEGRVILQKTEEIQNIIERPQNPRHRVIAQKSIFVRPPQGYIDKPHEDNVVIIPGDLKQWILQYLQQYHGISKEAIYNDVYGFIRYQDIHGGAYTQFFGGFAYQKRGDEATTSEERQMAYKKSIEHYTRAIDLNPNLTEVYNNLGLIYEQKGDYQKAIENFDRAIDLNPDFAGAYSNLGLVYERKKDHEEAIKNFDRAIDLNPNDVAAYNNRGIAYGRKGDYGKAIENYTQAIQLNPDFAETYYNRGNAYNSKDEHDCAIANYTQAIQLNPNDARVYYGRGVAYRQRGDYECAIANYTKAIQLNPDYIEAYNNRGAAYGQRGDYECAIADLDKAIGLNPNYAGAYNNLGNVYNDKGEHEYAIVAFNKATQLKPDYAEAYNNLGNAYYKKGDYMQAIANYTKAIELNPNYTNAHNNRNTAQRELERLNESS